VVANGVGEVMDNFMDNDYLFIYSILGFELRACAW
jgi:hypothetical protein